MCMCMRMKGQPGGCTVYASFTSIRGPTFTFLALCAQDGPAAAHVCGLAAVSPAASQPDH